MLSLYFRSFLSCLLVCLLSFNTPPVHCFLLHNRSFFNLKTLMTLPSPKRKTQHTLAGRRCKSQGAVRLRAKSKGYTEASIIERIRQVTLVLEHVAGRRTSLLSLVISPFPCVSMLLITGILPNDCCWLRKAIETLLLVLSLSEGSQPMKGSPQDLHA